jgi:hypothetical protein
MDRRERDMKDFSLDALDVEVDMTALFGGGGEGAVSFTGRIPKDETLLVPDGDARFYLGEDSSYFGFKVGRVHESGFDITFNSAGEIKYVPHNEAEIEKLGRGRIF